MNPEEFLANEQRILAEMAERGSKARETGLVSKLPPQGQVQTGALVYFTYDPSQLDVIGEFSDAIHKSLNGRSMIYSPEKGNIHTSLATHGVKTSSEPESLDAQLSQLSGVVERVAHDFNEYLAVNVYGAVHDESTVVVRPVDSFSSSIVNLVGRLIGKSSETGLELKRAWGRHITIARFTDQIAPPEMERFNDLMDYSKIRIPSTYLLPTHIAVGSFLLDRNSFVLGPYSSVSIQE